MLMVDLIMNCVNRIVLVGGCMWMILVSDSVVVSIIGLRIDVLNRLSCLLFFYLIFVVVIIKMIFSIGILWVGVLIGLFSFVL